MKLKRFDLFGTTYEVKMVDSIPVDEENGFCFGKTDSVTKTILIATKDRDGNPFPEEELELTLYHELFHSILGEGCYANANNDEPMVEWLGKCLRSLVKQRFFV